MTSQTNVRIYVTKYLLKIKIAAIWRMMAWK